MNPKRRVLRMRQLRRARELTQGQIAERVGLRPSSISDFEKGKAKPSVDSAIALARELGCHVEELFEYVEVPA